MEKFEIACLVDNYSGVLTRVASMFTRRGFNINSLTVGATEDPAISRITISVNGDEKIRSQCIKQLRKLYCVKTLRKWFRPSAYRANSRSSSCATPRKPVRKSSARWTFSAARLSTSPQHPLRGNYRRIDKD
ncbi:acetolactate synthase small subunit [Allobaculum sp. Allo2]|uniref:acetolactate synthase small subunit n=1 Tax=Allobaculum sp. Allo2 TaxID=2853432 RepID=UPI001F60F842|nr:acetolactate synthase small subunit [Allobaculum sp. Allo2]